MTAFLLKIHDLHVAPINNNSCIVREYVTPLSIIKMVLYKVKNLVYNPSPKTIKESDFKHEMQTY